MIHRKTLHAALAASTALLALSAPAQAQDTSSDQAQQDAAQNEIIVTAQRREQLLVDVPQSISVVSGDTLEQQGARSFLDYAQLIPGLSLTQDNPGETRLILRGINTGGVSSTVAVYVDDVPFGASGSLSNSGILAGDFDTFDVARVEVLKGPQGTLYGTNALGGVSKFITALPSTTQFEMRAQAGIEDTRFGELGYLGNAMINVPLGDTLAFRASGYFKRNGGYIDVPARGGENVNRTDSYGVRASLLFTPSDNFSVRLFGLMQNIETDSTSNFAVDPVTLRPIDPVTGEQLSKADRRGYERIPEFNRIDYRLYSGTINYDFGFANLTSITSYSEQKRDELGDESTNATFQLLASLIYTTPTAFDTVGTAFENDVEVEKFTQEIRLQSPDSDSFEWLIGGYYTKEDTALIQEILPFTLATQQFIPPATTIPDAFDLAIPGLAGTQIDNFVTSSIRAKYEEYAAFASVTAKFGERFDITAGGRYSRNEQSAEQAVIQFSLGAPQFAESSEDVFTWSVSPRFEINDRVSLFGRVAKGYRPGGPTFVPPGAPADFPSQFESDSVISYELGLRAQTLDRTFAVDAAIYQVDWDNILIASTVDVEGTPVGVNTNGQRARSRGAEVTATLRPTGGLSVTAVAAYNDAKLLDDTTPPDGGLNLTGGLAGDRLPYAPEITATLAIDYEWSLADNVRAFVGGNVRMQSDQVAGFAPDYRAAFGRRIEIDGYQTVDLRAGVDFGRFTVQAFARNLFDEYGIVGAGAFPTAVQPALGGSGLQYMTASTIRPRTIGLIIGAEF
jgi:iron complex outermembrane receptor protein